MKTTASIKYFVNNALHTNKVSVRRGSGTLKNYWLVQVDWRNEDNINLWESAGRIQQDYPEFQATSNTMGLIPVN